MQLDIVGLVAAAANARIAAAQIVVGGVGAGGRKPGGDRFPSDYGGQLGATVQTVIGCVQIAIDQQIPAIVGVAAPLGQHPAVGLIGGKGGDSGGVIVFRHENVVYVIAAAYLPILRIGWGFRVRLPGSSVDGGGKGNVVDLAAAAVFDDVAAYGDIIGGNQPENQVVALRPIRQGNRVILDAAGQGKGGKLRPGLP